MFHIASHQTRTQCLCKTDEKSAACREREDEVRNTRVTSRTNDADVQGQESQGPGCWTLWPWRQMLEPRSRSKSGPGHWLVGRLVMPPRTTPAPRGGAVLGGPPGRIPVWQAFCVQYGEHFVFNMGQAFCVQTHVHTDMCRQHIYFVNLQ